MQLEKISLSDTHSFSPFFLDYITGATALRPFYQFAPDIENFEKQLALKASFPSSSRKTLTAALNEQYDSLAMTDRVRENIASLELPETFTITTGHQLNIFTGPLYFINKIVTAINTCRSLKDRYPRFNFVPMYWMASEDHDFEEISYFLLYGKKYTWQTKQTGAVGRFNPATLKEILNELPGDVSAFEEAYLQHTSLSDAVRSYVNALFGDQGLVVVDADDRALKKQLAHVMEDDLFRHTVRQLVEKDTVRLQALGYHTQVNARDINFFFLNAEIRDRIEKDGDLFSVVGQDMRYSESEMMALIAHEPEKISPNVILRPLYQEIILPNLAYIGGPSEVVYWLQLKSVFEHFEVPFPILMPRNFSMIMDSHVVRKFEKTGLAVSDLFKEKNSLSSYWTLKNSTQNLSLKDDIEKVRSVFGEINKQAGSIDATLKAHVSAKESQAVHDLETIEKKMLRAEKRKLSDKLRQIETLKDELFPNGSLQERTDNFLNFSQKNSHFIADLLAAFDPFDYRMFVLMYND